MDAGGLNLRSIVLRAITQVDHLLLVMKEPAGQHRLDPDVSIAVSHQPGDYASAAITVLQDVMRTLRSLEGGLTVPAEVIPSRPVEVRVILELLANQLEVIEEVMDGGRSVSCATNMRIEQYARMAISQPTVAVFSAVSSAVQMLRTNQQARSSVRV